MQNIMVNQIEFNYIPSHIYLNRYDFFFASIVVFGIHLVCDAIFLLYYHVRTKGIWIYIYKGHCIIYKGKYNFRKDTKVNIRIL